MKILIYCKSLSQGFGGMERTAVNLCNEMHRRGHSVMAVYGLYLDCFRPSYPLNPSIDVLPWSDDIDERVFIQRIKLFNPDVALLLYSNFDNILLPYRLLANCGLPLVLHEGTNPNRISETWNRHQTKQKNLFEREGFHAGASYIRVTMSSYMPSVRVASRLRIVSFPNAFPINSKMKQPSSKRQIIHINGFKENKNFVPLIKAFSLLHRDFPDWELRMIGRVRHKSPYHMEIHDIIEKNELEESVVLVGATDDMEQEFANADIHVISSRSEGLPNAVAEAMCAGVPSIGFLACEGTNELIIEGKNGTLVDDSIGEVESLEFALRELMNDTEKRQRMGRQAKEDSMVFEPNAVFDQWENLLQNAVADGEFALPLKNARNDAGIVGEIALHKSRYLRMLGISVDSNQQAKSIDRNNDQIESPVLSVKPVILFVLTNSPLGSLGTTGTFEVIRNMSQFAQTKVFSLPRPNRVKFDDEEFDVTYLDSFSGQNVDLICDYLKNNQVGILHLYRGKGEFEFLKKIKSFCIHNALDTQIIYDIKSPILKEKKERDKLILEVQRSAPLIDHIITLSDTTLRDNMTLPLCDHSIIPLGVKISPEMRNIDSLNMVRRFVYIGSLAENRKLIDVVKWFGAYVKEYKSDLTLDLYGSGSGEKQIASYITEAKLEGSICCRGFLQQSELFEKIDEYDAGIAYVPDNEIYSGSPSLKSIEYAALGLPFIACATSAHKLYAQQFNIHMGFFEDNQESFYKALLKLTSDIVDLHKLEENMESAKQFDYGNIVTRHILPAYNKAI